MTWQRIDDKIKIMGLIDHLVSEKAEINIRIQGEKNAFASRFTGFNPVLISSGCRRGSSLIVETLLPGKGNVLIRSAPEVDVAFSIRRNLYRCKMEYIGTRSMHSRFGLILTFPECIEFQENQMEGRLNYTPPENLKVELRPGKKPEKGRLYKLRVNNLSEYGLGLIITHKDSDLLQILHSGDMLEEITFVAPSAMVRTHGTVGNISRIEDGEHKDCNLLRIEFPEIGAS